MRLFAHLVGLALAALAGPAQAAAASCTAVAAVPYIVTQPGRYCLTRDVATSSFGFLITTDDVEIDLQGHRLVGPLDPATNEPCIVSYGYERITVRNGAIEGCLIGVFLSDDYDAHWQDVLPGGQHVVEKMDIARSSFRGIRVEGHGNVIRDNVVRFIGGSTAYPVSHMIAIESVGPGATIERNFVHEARGAPGYEGVGISVSDMGSGCIVRHNFLSQAAIDQPVGRGAWPNAGRSTWGIWIGGVATRGLVVEGNSIVNFAHGVTIHRTSQAILTRNTVAGAIVPYYLPTLDGSIGMSTLAEDNICDKANCVERLEQYYILP